MINSKTGKNARGRAARWLTVAVLLAALTAGCVRLQELVSPSAPDVADEWATLLNEIRAFERRIGFADTDNFAEFSREQNAFPFCGYVSRLYLPYSYEDPAITWLDSETEEECRARGRDADVYFGTVEAWGEVGSPVTPSMITSRLDRFLYLVIHEDCHDQFDLPYGIEEALCNLITYKAMAVFSEEKFGRYARENRVVRRYADTQSGFARATIAYYQRLAALYARYQRGEIPPDALLQERATIFNDAETALAWTKGELNNVSIANDMTYSRHYPFLESVFDALQRDPARTVAFFRRVDGIKPSEESVIGQHRIARQGSVEFIRVYEAAVVETIRNALQESGAGNAAKR